MPKTFSIDKYQDVTLDEDKHLYTNQKGEVLTSVTKFLSTFEEPFDAQRISFFVARKRLREQQGWEKGDPEILEEQIKELQKVVLAEWETKRSKSADHGTAFHKIMEDAIVTGKVPVEDATGAVQDLLTHYSMIYKEVRTEQIVYDLQSMIAGKADLIMIRKTKNLIIDIDDFKTNLFKGIVFDSITWKDEKPKHNSKFLLPPLDHIEDCTYNKDVLQLSIYAYLCETLFDAKIGRLGIRWLEISESEDIISIPYIPVPYMRGEVMRIVLEHSQKNTSTGREDDF